MRYPKDHKQKTHAQILAAAARAFRAEGIGVGVSDVMGQAGLTHGGFYAHFASKNALVAEIAEHCLNEMGDRLLEAARGAPADPVDALLAVYLTPEHRDRPDTGCPIPALAGEIARQPAEVRRAFTRALERYIQQLAGTLPGNDPEGRTDDALAMLSGMVGAMLLARAIDDPALSQRTLAAAHSRLRAAFGGPRTLQAVRAGHLEESDD